MNLEEIKALNEGFELGKNYSTQLGRITLGSAILRELVRYEVRYEQDIGDIESRSLDLIMRGEASLENENLRVEEAYCKALTILKKAEQRGFNIKPEVGVLNQIRIYYDNCHKEISYLVAYAIKNRQEGTKNSRSRSTKMNLETDTDRAAFLRDKDMLMKDYKERCVLYANGKLVCDDETRGKLIRKFHNHFSYLAGTDVYIERVDEEAFKESVMFADFPGIQEVGQEEAGAQR